MKGVAEITLPEMTVNLVLLVPLLCSTAAALQMTGPSTYTASIGSIAHIPCTFTADELPADPKYFAVLWYLEGKMILSYDDTVPSTHPRYSLDKYRALYGTADLIISNAFVSDGGDYTCSVTYTPLRTEKKIRVEISAAALQMTGPSTYTASVGSIAHIPCTFTADKLPADPKYFAVFWYLEGKMILTYDNIVTSTDPRYSLDKSRALYGIADLTISNAFVSDGGDYTCSVTYSYFQMENEIRVEFSGASEKYWGSKTEKEIKDTEYINFTSKFHPRCLARPQLSILSRSVQRNTENTLTCVVSGFFPSDIDVTWYKEGEVLKNQLMGKPQKYGNGTYQVISTVTITPSDDDQNKTFSCRVRHVSLQEPLQEEFQLIFQESSSHVVILCIVIPVVVIIAGIIGIVLWKLIQHRRAPERPITDCKHLRAMYLKGSSGQQVGDNTWSFKDMEKEKFLNTIKGQLPDPEIGEITVPDLIAGKKATLSCKIYNYILGEHECSWYVKVKSTGDVIPANYDRKKLQTIGKDETSDGQNTFIAYLVLVPVGESDDGSEFILRVELPDCVIERRTGPIHVKGNPRLFLTPDKRKNEISVNIEEGKDQCTESSAA